MKLYVGDNVPSSNQKITQVQVRITFLHLYTFTVTIHTYIVHVHEANFGGL